MSAFLIIFWVLMGVIVSVTMSMAISMIMLCNAHQSVNPDYVRETIRPTVQEHNADEVKTKADTADDHDKLWLFDLCTVDPSVLASLVIVIRRA